MEDVAWCSCCGAALDICVLIEHGAACKSKRQTDAVSTLRASLPASLPLVNAASPWTLEQMFRIGSDCMPDEAWGPKDRSAASWSARDASEILPGLYLGNIVAARDIGFLREKGIKGIVNCANEASPLSAADLAAAGVRKLVHLPLHDDCEPATVARSMSLILRGAHAAAALAAFGGDADATAASLVAGGVPLAVPGAAVTAEQAAAAAAVSHMSCSLLGPAAAADGAAAGSAIHAAPLPNPVFIHCAVGRSRSASVVAAFLVLFRGLRLLDAMLLLRHRRPIVMPNLGFFAALVAIEELANARKAAASAAAVGEAGAAAVDAPAAAAGGAGGAAAVAALAAAPVASSGGDAVPCAMAPPGCSIDGRLLALHPNGSHFERFQAYTGRRMPGDPWVEVLAAARKHGAVEGAAVPPEEVVAMIRDGVAAPHPSATSRGR